MDPEITSQTFETEDASTESANERNAKMYNKLGSDSQTVCSPPGLNQFPTGDL